MAVVMNRSEQPKPDRDPNAGMVAGLVREAEMAQANPRISEEERAQRLTAIGDQLEHYGADRNLAGGGSKPAAKARSTRTSKAAGARAKRGSSSKTEADD